MVRVFDRSFGAAFVLSGAIHILLLGQLSLSLSQFNVFPEERPIPVDLIEVVQPREKTLPLRPKELSKEPERSVEPKTDSSRGPRSTPDISPLALPGSGIELGEGKRADTAMVPGRGSGVDGERGSSQGEGSGTSNPGKGEKGFREARPLQTVRASYPPMALRMGVEADVELKIQVDAEGNMIKAEIVKSAGMGFDDEAVKAVRQFHFEPARKDGKNIASEFTYIYRFRLER